MCTSSVAIAVNYGGYLPVESKLMIFKQDFISLDNDKHGWFMEKRGEERDEKGRFKPGHPGQKPVGAKSELRRRVQDFVDERWDDLPKWFDTLKEKDKLQIIVELLPYLIPKLKQIDLDVYNQHDERAMIGSLFPDYFKTLGKDEPT